MRKLVFILLGFLFFNNAVAQKTNQSYGYAFSIIIQPGTIPIYENGVPMKIKINRERFIYVMVPGKNKPTIKTVSYNKTAVKWDILNVAEKEYAPVSESTQKKSSIKPFKGGSMWRVNIQELANHPIQTKLTPIIIKGSIGTKPFKAAIAKETAVQGFDSY